MTSIIRYKKYSRQKKGGFTWMDEEKSTLSIHCERERSLVLVDLEDKHGIRFENWKS